MDTATNSPVRFGVFELDARTGELRRSGNRVALQPQPLEILRALLERPGEVVTREELRRRVWKNGAYLDFDRSLNKAMVKLRDALGDDADSPRYIETLPRHGYRFIPFPQVQARLDAALPAQAALTAGMPQPEGPASPQLTSVSRVQTAGAHHGWRWAALGLSLLALAGWLISSWFRMERGGTKPVELTNFQQPAQRTAEVAPAIHSLAVLPLENLSGDKEQEYFAEGMTDALTTDLAQIGSLRVISRTSAMHFKGSKETLPQIGRELKVDAIVEGAVTRGENRVRVTAQLVDARSDHHLWAKSYERDLRDVVALQDEIAQDVANQIRVKLTPKERSLLSQAHAVDPEAHDAYLRGLYWTNERTPESARKGLDYFQKAIAKDPNYALAYAGVARSFLVLAFTNGLPFKEALPKAKEVTIKALELDPSLAEARAFSGHIKFLYDWDWSGAEEDYKQAITLNPNHATAHFFYSVYLVAMERLDEAVNEAKRAQDLDPFSVPINLWVVEPFRHSHQYDEARRESRRFIEMYPDRPEGYEYLGNVYEAMKIFPEAFAAYQQMLSMKKDPTVSALAEAYRRSGYKGYLLKWVQILEQSGHAELGIHQYAQLHYEAHALFYLERAYEEHIPYVLFLRTTPEFDSIRSSPRFGDLVRRIGLPRSSSDVRTSFP